MTTFHIVRHAEKEKGDFYNPRLRHRDQPISPKGRADSKKLWAYFSDKQVSAIYVSEYQRTTQTIEYVARHLNLSPVMDERLNEIDNELSTECRLWRNYSKPSLKNGKPCSRENKTSASQRVKQAKKHENGSLKCSKKNASHTMAKTSSSSPTKD